MFNIQTFYFLPTECVYVVCMDHRKTTIISLHNINGLGFVTRGGGGEYLLRGASRALKYNSD
jgi:hypothetical protein